MPRIPRGQVAGHAYHVLNRGNGGAAVFHQEGAYTAVLDLLATAKATYPVYCSSSACHAGSFRSIDSRRHARRRLCDPASCNRANGSPALSLRVMIVYPVVGCSTWSCDHGGAGYGSISPASSWRIAMELGESFHRLGAAARNHRYEPQ